MNLTTIHFRKNDTPIDIAFKCGNEAILEYLGIQHNTTVNIYIENDNGQNIFHWLTIKNRLDLIRPHLKTRKYKLFVEPAVSWNLLRLNFHRIFNHY